MSQKPKLKEARYECWAHGPEFPEYNKVVYVIIGDCCYFSGIEKNFRTSTINAAESIIQAISNREETNVAKLRWFDLLTYRGYHKMPGGYELAEMIIGPNTSFLMADKSGYVSIEVDGEKGVLLTGGTEDFTVTYWNYKAPCPQEVLQIFHEYIGTDFYAKSVEVLKLSPQICSYLQNIGVGTVDKLIYVSWSELKKCLTTKQIMDVIDAMSEYKLHIEDGLYQPEFFTRLSKGAVRA